MQYNPVVVEPLILCCQCGIEVSPNPSNMCINCIRNEVDITEGIPKQAIIHFCRNCERYLQPPTIWVSAELESKELLALCIKKLKGLNKVRLIDAGFIWTEPHSKRIKLKLTIQKEVFASTLIQQIFEVEFVVNHQQCNDCTKIMAKNTWKALVQVRQKVNHKRTFLFLEQLILKHHAHKDTINIKEVKDGLDFYYSNRSHANKMVEFLNSVVPVRTKTSEQLISTDIHNNTSNYKFSHSVEIVPICKDDLICLPLKISRSLGNISQLVICYRVGNSIHVMDPNTLAVSELATATYWRTPFNALASAQSLTEYYVLDVEPLPQVRGKYMLAEVQVAKSTDFGRNDQTYFVRTHLGNILKSGDLALGYDLTSSNFNDNNYDLLKHSEIPYVILIKKSYSNKRRKNKQRNWKLSSLNKEKEIDSKKQDLLKSEMEYELFLRELEEDTNDQMEVDEDNLEDDLPEIGIEELLEDLTLED
ncbi:16210_t:CDS:2 [Entrophospora sp. SA101]|nr:1051_t:CDS:2 [Entrophospora sp. SA101]CAJ0630217.1 2421_t:CDS:2 [Entrophospora sp. SA101]CAJ0650311.1 8405_t:CDS:2 [Entrophospora sp. SA101]CAJ0749740.1 11248_t:CDS:2 [Entrophospora sp. SA101]CAJ0758238.1 16210_t:CDS:2 [Entrophospora sp. SA101]